MILEARQWLYHCKDSDFCRFSFPLANGLESQPRDYLLHLVELCDPFKIDAGFLHSRSLFSDIFILDIILSEISLDREAQACFVKAIPPDQGYPGNSRESSRSQAARVLSSTGP